MRRIRWRQAVTPRAFWPTSLLGRNFALLALVIIMGAIGWASVFRYHQMEPRAAQAATFVVSVINLSRSALMSAQPELLRDLLQEFAEFEGIRIYPADVNDQSLESAPDRYLERVMSQVRGELGEATRFAIVRNARRGFFVSFGIDDDQYWAEFPLDRVVPPRSDIWIAWAIGVLALSLIMLYLIVYRIRAPLAALSGAAQTLGRGEFPDALALEGPAELRSLALAFNQMTTDLAHQHADRALILAGISHDLRTPLARLRLAIEMSAIDQESSEAMVEDIEEMNRIVGQFLDFARALSGEKPQWLRVSELAAEVLQREAGRGSAIESRILQTPRQRVRPVGLRRLLTNLIDNARRHAGEPLTLSVQADSREVVIEVLDRGPGIPAGETDRLRQPFQRLESARSNTGGSGLGLAIVDRIAQAHGGRLDLLPRDGGGLIARITLPLLGGQSDPTEPA